MRCVWYFALLALVFLAGTCTAEVPYLVGNWSGSGMGYLEGAVVMMNENDSTILNITEQNDRIFAGNLTFEHENGTYEIEGVAGAIGVDNKTLYMAEFDEGYDLGTIISDDEIELIYLQDGEPAEVFIERYHRMES